VNPNPLARQTGSGDDASKATLRARLRFAILFAVVAGAASLAYCFPYPAESPVQAWFATYLGAYAKTVAAVVSPLDATVRASGTDIVGRFALRVARDCDAMETDILLVAAILASPATWRQRALGVSVGVVVIAVTNVVRLSALYLIGWRWPSAFDFAHRELWPLVLIAVAFGIFVIWSGRLTRATAHVQL
jgi:exosortase/archaeosortase family protein